MRLIGLLVLLLGFSVSSLNAAGIRLENASYKSALSLFAAMTGNTYIGDFNTEKKITYFSEKDVSPEEAHKILESLIATLGGEISEINDNEFSITKIKLAKKKVEPPIEIPTVVNDIKRIDLDKKVSFNVLSQIVKLDPRFKTLSIIEDGTGSETIIVIGPLSNIEELELVISDLPKLKSTVKDKVDKTDMEEIIDEEKNSNSQIVENRKKIVIIDLNYADAMSLNEPLKALS